MQILLQSMCCRNLKKTKLAGCCCRHTQHEFSSFKFVCSCEVKLWFTTVTCCKSMFLPVFINMKFCQNRAGGSGLSNFKSVFVFFPYCRIRIDVFIHVMNEVTFWFATLRIVVFGTIEFCFQIQLHPHLLALTLERSP